MTRGQPLFDDEPTVVTAIADIDEITHVRSVSELGTSDCDIRAAYGDEPVPRFHSTCAERIAIGSSPTCTWVVADGGVRAVHAELVHMDDGWWLCAHAPVRHADLSGQGWFRLSSGDVVELGEARLTVTFAPPVAPEATSSVSPPPEPSPPNIAVDPRVVFRLPPPEEESSVPTEVVPRRRLGPRAWLLVAALASAAVACLVTFAGAGASAAPPDGIIAVEAPPAVRRTAPPDPATRPRAFDARDAGERMERGAAALLRGDRVGGLAEYRRLAVDLPGNPMIADFVRAIESDFADRCRREHRPAAECIP